MSGSTTETPDRWAVDDTSWSVLAFILMGIIFLTLIFVLVWSRYVLMKRRGVSLVDTRYKRYDENEGDLHYRITDLQKQLEQMKEANSDLRNRLSENMSAALRHNNPGIADLNDTNRPTKLGERYSELYDNQWSDAFDFLQEINALNPERDLLDIIMYFFSECWQFRHNQGRQLNDAFQLSDAKQQDIPTTLAAKLETTRKEICLNMLPQAKQFLVKKYGDTGSLSREILGEKRMRLYMEECGEVCWMMCLQNPPLFLTTDTGDGLFDKNLYKEYTVTGPYVDKVIWPVLLLQEGGPLVCKGVAQGCHPPQDMSKSVPFEIEEDQP